MTSGREAGTGTADVEFEGWRPVVVGDALVGGGELGRTCLYGEGKGWDGAVVD